MEAGFGVPKDVAGAARMYLRAAEAGHSGAQTNVGRCYRNGLGVVRACVSCAATHGHKLRRNFSVAISERVRFASEG